MVATCVTSLYCYHIRGRLSKDIFAAGSPRALTPGPRDGARSTNHAVRREEFAIHFLIREAGLWYDKLKFPVCTVYPWTVGFSNT